jgi:hypothetical protein
MLEPITPIENTTPLEHPEEGLFETYANAVDADWTLTDVTLRFMQLVYTIKEERATVSNRELINLEKANITVPWWTAKVGAQMLLGLVAAYESVNGEIKKPELARLPKPEGSSD